jgi:hypothetical protein
MKGGIRVAVVLSGVMLLGGVEAAGQSRSTELRIGAGYNYIWYTENEDRLVALRGGVRFPVSPRLSLEPEATFGRGTETLGPTGQSVATTQAWTVGLNLIASKNQGKVRPYGGGGAGLFYRRRVFETTVESGPRPGVFRTVTDTGPVIAGQAIVGVDVTVAESTALFAEFRVNALAASAGAVGFWYLGGVRIALR